MNNIIAEIRTVLEQNIDTKTQATSQNYFKEKIKFYGVQVNRVSKISKEFFNQNLNKLPKGDIFNLCNTLWESGYIEESFVASNWAYMIHEQFEPVDFEILSYWVNNHVNNWASCDTLCNHAVAAFIEMYPEYIGKLKEWAKSDNRWARRAAAVTFILPARKGKFLEDIFEIADILLMDEDDLVRKGYGWMLKAASEANQKEVFEYVISKKAVMPRTSLRYAIEKMPPDLRALAMKK